MSRDQQERELAYWLAQHVDDATPYRANERTLLQRLESRAYLAGWVDSWAGVSFLVAVAAVAAFSRWSAM